MRHEMSSATVRDNTTFEKNVSATILFIDNNERVLLMTKALGYFELIQSNIRTSSI